MREDQREGRHATSSAGDDRAPRDPRAGQRPDRGHRRRRRPRASGPSRPPPARNSWESPRRPCRAPASSPPPASRRPPRCSPRRPWPARSTAWSGLKENVILGHLIPAGTGFRTYQDAEVRYPAGRPSKRWRPQPRKTCWSRHFPLLETGPETASRRDGDQAAPCPRSRRPSGGQEAGPSPLDALFGRAGAAECPDEGSPARMSDRAPNWPMPRPGPISGLRPAVIGAGHWFRSLDTPGRRTRA